LSHKRREKRGKGLREREIRDGRKEGGRKGGRE
jgi:hypothetical protein